MPTEPALPEGRPAGDVLAELRALRAADAPTRGGRTFAYVYDAGLAGLDELAAEAYTTFATVNGLDPTVFPSVARLENDVVGAVAALLGTPGAQGTWQSTPRAEAAAAISATGSTTPWAYEGVEATTSAVRSVSAAAMAAGSARKVTGSTGTTTGSRPR